MKTGLDLLFLIAKCTYTELENVKLTTELISPQFLSFPSHFHAWKSDNSLMFAVCLSDGILI